MLDDPDVQINWQGQTLTLPFSHPLPFIWSVHDDYNQNLARVAAACQRKYKDATMIDVGANVGDSVVVVRAKIDMPILCVEGDARYLRYLRWNTRRYDNVEIAPHYVGERHGEEVASVVSERGSGHLEFDGLGTTRVSLRTLSTLASEHPRFGDPTLLKIDTDGLDTRILIASGDFLRERLPVIFFEYDPGLMGPHGDDAATVFPFLKSIGYEGLAIWDNHGDYVLSTRTQESALLANLHQYFSGGDTQRYVDIAAFPELEADIFHEVGEAESAHRRARLTASHLPG